MLGSELLRTGVGHRKLGCRVWGFSQGVGFWDVGFRV